MRIYKEQESNLILPEHDDDDDDDSARKFHEKPSGGSRCMRTDGQTQDETNSHFFFSRSFVKAPTNYVVLKC